MRAVFGLVLIVGIALAGGAVMLVQKTVENYEAQLAQARSEGQPAIPTRELYVANRQLRYGERLDPESVTLINWPLNAVPEGAFTADADLFPADETDNRFVLRAMEPGEPILAIKVTDPGEDAGITSRLERGMRAFAIKVDVASGVSGFLRPGDRVDVYWTGNLRNVDEGERGDITRLIESGVKLIAIDQSAGGDIEGALIARTVTVAATPQQVAALAQAQTTGRLSLALVGADDDTIASVIEVDQRSLLGIEERQEVVEAPKEEVCTIRQRRGAEVVDIPIPCTN
ncbi:MAG TPA: Flp pilus assembly protein CpaB [Rhodobacteraceae bacterium]|jgi:pilus assembly protein CpaB|nr:Flp pilus assembly protein CpaB [Paracoccaceae bacterium]